MLPMLRELQEAFLKFFYQRESNDYLKYIRLTKNGMSPQERFAIYEGSITEGLLKGLRETFPVTEKLVGEDFFRAMGYCFIEKNASRSPNLYDYGDAYPDFVAEFPPAKTLSYLSDVCRLEWAWQQAYDGSDHHFLDVNSLLKIDSEQYPFIIFQRACNSTLIESPYPIHDIWHMNQHDDVNDITVDLDSGGIRLMVWRPSMEVLIETLTEAQWKILQLLNRGVTLGQITESLSKDKVDLNKEIPAMVSRGWINQYRGLCNKQAS